MGELFLLLALTGAGANPSDDPMILWDCDRAGGRLVVQMVQPPVEQVTKRENFLFSGTPGFEQCRLGQTTWTLLVDIVEYEDGPCEFRPDTIVSLMRNDRLVLSSVVVGENCGNRPVLTEARIADRGATPRIEVCATPAYPGEGRCAPLVLRRMKNAADNETLKALAGPPRAGAAQ
ncbi:MAG: hypothetical protein ACREVQ_14930 [Burkholderiales bacterium]